MFVTISFSSNDTSNLKEALAIRTAVFVQEQGVDPTLEYDEHDTESHHYLCKHDGKAIGTGRWRETAEGIKLERFAVLANYRNQGIGALILKKMLEEILPLKKTVYLNAQLTAVAFYQKHGFVVQGEVFYEANIGHLKMFYKCP
jgi:predicted GNAT family N-acyltransferase